MANNIESPNNIFELENAVMADLTNFNKEYKLYVTCGDTTVVNRYFDRSICNGNYDMSIDKLNTAYARLVNDSGTGSLNRLANAINSLSTTSGGTNLIQYTTNYNIILNKYNEVVKKRQSLDAKLAELYEIGDTTSNFYQKKLISTSYTKILLTVLASGLVVTAFMIAKRKT